MRCLQSDEARPPTGGGPYPRPYSSRLLPPQEPRHVHLGVSERRPTWRDHSIALASRWAEQAPHVSKRQPPRMLLAPPGRHRARAAAPLRSLVVARWQAPWPLRVAAVLIPVHLGRGEPLSCTVRLVRN